MSEKSIWNKLVSGVTGRTDSATGATTGRRCEAGHPMDPSWDTCPYCEAEKRAQNPTAFHPPESEPVQTEQRRPTMARRPTMTPGSGPSSERGATKIETSADFPADDASQRTDTRKITGVLVTFSWKPQGQLFIIREGRNVIGSGSITSEGGRPCDIQVADSMLSNEHALILCRAGRYELMDLNSTNGSYLNDQFVESQGAAIPDRGKIKTGATVWTFLKIESETSEIQQAPPAPSTPAQERPRRGETDAR
jgi:hypothetical protein